MRTFTPLYDDVVQKYDIYTAAVFGKVLRYCQGERGMCFASQTRIAKELDISREKVHSALALLVLDGMLDQVSTAGKTSEYRPGPMSDSHRYVWMGETAPVDGINSKKVSKKENNKQGLDGRKPDLADAAIHYSGKTSFHKAPAHLRALLGKMLEHHTETFGFKFVQADRGSWIKWAGEMVSTFGEELMPELYDEAAKHYDNQPLTYARPRSLETTIQKVAAGQVDSDQNESTLRPFSIVVE